MSTVEILVMLTGAVVFIISFFIPMGKKSQETSSGGMSEEQIREVVGKEIDANKYRLEEIVSETISYAMEKTERSMERLSNEKIMELGEYSDTVFKEIHKNHQEAVFLYDMLSDKHEKLTGIVSDASRTETSIKQTLKDVEIAAKEVEIAAKEVENLAGIEHLSHHTDKDGFTFIRPEKIDVNTENIISADGAAYAPAEEMSLNTEKISNKNKNDRVLELHEAGMSNVTIARELGLGVGEVKLVIDLFEGL